MTYKILRKHEEVYGIEIEADSPEEALRIAREEKECDEFYSVDQGPYYYSIAQDESKPECLTHREWIETSSGREMLAECEDEATEFYYKAMHDYGLDLCDADRYAWLNTLIGYDIGAEQAMAIINWLWGVYEECEVLELTKDDKHVVELAAEKLGFNIDFSGWATEEPKAFRYNWR